MFLNLCKLRKLWAEKAVCSWLLDMKTVIPSGLSLTIFPSTHAEKCLGKTDICGSRYFQWFILTDVLRRTSSTVMGLLQFSQPECQALPTYSPDWLWIPLRVRSLENPRWWLSRFYHITCLKSTLWAAYHFLTEHCCRESVAGRDQGPGERCVTGHQKVMPARTDWYRPGPAGNHCHRRL